jgi:hypothetical protein
MMCDVVEVSANRRRRRRRQIQSTFKINRETIWTTSGLSPHTMFVVMLVIMLMMDQSKVESFMLLHVRHHPLQHFQDTVLVDNNNNSNNKKNFFRLLARPARNLQKIRQKQKEKIPPQQSLDFVNDNDHNEHDIPANLKRQVEAKRPALGHVVPAATRVRGCKRSIHPYCVLVF